MAIHEPHHDHHIRASGVVSKRLNECARKMLPFVPPYPGLPWFEIISRGPRQANGNTIPKRYGLDPLVNAGLVLIEEGAEKPNGGGRYWDRYYRPQKDKTTGEVAAMCGVTPRDVRRRVHRGDIPDGPKGVSGQGMGNALLWSPAAVEQALARSKEVRGHGYNRPGMTRGPGKKLADGIRAW